MSQLTLPSLLTHHSVLPDNHSGLERALELSFSDQLYRAPVPYPQLFDARHTSLSLLPYLAAERQLPLWDASAPTHIQRSLTHQGWQIRKLSGTRAGLSMALASFGFACDITPWYQQVPQGEPYSISIVAWEQGNNFVNDETYHKLFAYLEACKSERDQLDLSLRTTVQAGCALIGVVSPAISVQPLNIVAVTA